MIFAAQPCFSMPLPGHRLTTVDHPVPRSSCRRHTCMAQDYRLVATGAAPTRSPEHLPFLFPAAKRQTRPIISPSPSRRSRPNCIRKGAAQIGSRPTQEPSSLFC